MPLVTRIDTIFVPAIDTAAAADWYARLFGMERIFESAGYIGLRFAAGAETALTLFPAQEIDRDAHYRFNFHTDDPQALHDRLTAAGVAATPIEAAGPVVHFEFRDVSGNRVNICHVAGGG